LDLIRIEHRECEPAFDAELLKDVAQVGRHCLLADAQPASDLLVAKAARDSVDDLLFPSR
jgi:hypothetical protein